MKFALLAASALAMTAVPAFAQDTQTAPPPPEAATQDAPMEQTTPPADPAMQTPPPADPAMQAPPPADPAMQTTQTPPATTGSMTNGGYAPSGAPMMGAPAPGAQVVFKPSMPVAQAFPPPPPKDSYPTCTRTLRDGCTNPGRR